MAGRTAQPHLEELLSHAEWLRALARRLVTDAAAAADLVQETWLAAIRNPPDPERPAKPWLAGVLRNLVRLRARTEGRRTRRQKIAARKDELPSTAELIERVDTGRQLTETVLELPEPFRTTVLLRYQHDLSAAEIARRQGVPAGTVRWRLKRGLTELRGRLDARYPDRASWCLALAALEHTGGSGGGVGLASGTSLVTALKVGASLAVGGVLLWLPLRHAVRANDDFRTAPIAALRGDAARVGTLERPDDPAAFRRAALGTHGEDMVSAALERRPSRLRVMRPDGTPVAGLPTVVLDSEGEDHSATTDADGFATYGASPGAGVFYAMQPGAFLERHDVELGEADGVVTIEPGSALAGLVTLDGRVPREPLELHLLLDQFAAVDIAWSGPGGRGRSTMRLRGPDVPLDLDLGDLVLAHFPVTSFRVLDDAGLPIAGAVAQTLDGLTRSAPTGADGVGSIRIGERTFRISARGFRAQDVAARPASETVVRLERGNRLTLRIRAGGEAIAAAEVTLSTTGEGEQGGRVVLRADEAGRVELENLFDGTPIALAVRDVLGDVIHEEQLAALLPTEDRVHDVVVTRTLRTLAGRAVDPSGAPIVGTVLFVESPEGGRRFKTRTTVPGTFSIPFLGAETVDIVLKKRGFATTVVRRDPLAPEVPLDIRMAPGRDVLVRVADERGEPVIGGTVVARSLESGLEWTARRAEESGCHELVELEVGELEVSLVVGGWTYTRNHDTHDAELSFEIPMQGAVAVRYAVRADLALGECQIVLAPRDSRGRALAFQPAERSGTHGFQAVRPGLYDVFVERQTRADGRAERIGASVPVSVGADGVTRVELAP